jgi:hypothetical protein
MASQEELENLQELLETYRANLYTLEKQRGTFGPALVPPYIVLQIKQFRQELAQVKQALRDAGVEVDDQLIDSDWSKGSSSAARSSTPAKSPPAQTPPAGSTTMTGPVTINQFHGPIQNSILNISAQLDNVSQNVSSIPHINNEQKDELRALTEELKKRLLQLSSQGQQADAEQISKRLNNTIGELQEEEPDRPYIEKQLASIQKLTDKHEELKPSSEAFFAKVIEALAANDNA